MIINNGWRPTLERHDTMTEKMTYVDALTSAINGDLTDAVVEKLTALRTSLLKRNTSGVRKPTAKQTANIDVRGKLVKYICTMTPPQEAGFLVSDLIAGCDVVAGKSPQYVSAILRQAYLAKEVSKRVMARKTYYIPYDPSIVVED